MKHKSEMIRRDSKWGRLATLFRPEIYKARNIEDFLNSKNQIKLTGKTLGLFKGTDYGCAYIGFQQAKCRWLDCSNSNRRVAILSDQTRRIKAYIEDEHMFYECYWTLTRPDRKNRELLLQEPIIEYNGHEDLQWLFGFENMLPGDTPFAPEDRTDDYYKAFDTIDKHALMQRAGMKGILDLESLVSIHGFDSRETDILREYAGKVRAVTYNLTNTCETAKEEIAKALFKGIAIEEHTDKISDEFLKQFDTLRDEAMTKLKRTA